MFDSGHPLFGTAASFDERLCGNAEALVQSPDRALAAGCDIGTDYTPRALLNAGHQPLRNPRVIRRALEFAGVEFIDQNGNGG